MDYILDDDFRKRLPQHTKQQRLNLEAKIAKEGCLKDALTVAIIGDQNILCDGYTTLAICQEKELDLTEPRSLVFANREEVLEWIDERQQSRRNTTAEAMAENRAKRIERVAEGRTQGKPIRALAEEEGVSAATIHDDIKIATVQGRTVDPPNGKVTGSDGRQKPSSTGPKYCLSCDHKKKVGKPLPDACPDCKKLRKKPSTLKPKNPDDLPKSVANALADTWHAECARLLSKMRTECKGAFGWSSWLDGSVLDHLKNAEECFVTAIPRKVCPDCKGQKAVNKESCQTCRGGGYLGSQE